MNTTLIRCLAGLAFAFFFMKASAQQLPLKYFGQDEGLGNLAVTALAQDATGYLWVGTESGLFRFNGAEFRRYGETQGLDDPYVTAVFESRPEGMWVGTYSNLYRTEGERLIPVLFQGKPIQVSPGQIFAVEPGKGALLVTEGRLLAIARHGGATGVRAYFTPEQIRSHRELEKIGSIYADADGSLWMACAGSVCNIAQGRVSVKGRADGLPEDKWTSIARDTGGTLWVRSATRVFAMPVQDGRFTERTPSAMHKRALRSELHVDETGHVITNTDSGLVRWQQGAWQSYGKEHGLIAAGGVTAILRDREHGVWLGTLGHGLAHWLGYGNLENWTSAQGLPDDVIISVQRDHQGILHVGTRSGHAWQAPGERRFLANAAPADYAGHQWASMSLDTAGRLWAGTYSGLLLRHVHDTETTALIAHQPLINLVLANHGQIWIGTSEGLRVLPEAAAAGTQPQAAPIPAAAGGQLKSHVAGGCADRHGHLWFASNSDILHDDGRGWERLAFGAALGDRVFMAIACARDDTLLASTGGALWQLQTRGRPTATRIDAPVLRDRAIHTVSVDSRGWIWAGLDVGFAVWNRSRWRVLNQTHGLAWNDSNGRGIYEDQDGSMWLITSNGLSHVLHPERLFAPTPGKPVIEEARRGDHAMPATRGALPWTPDQLVFRLANLHYENRQAFRYRFRLLGVDDHWNESVQPEVRYAALPGGDYRFQLVTIDTETGEQSSPAELAFSIAPPWWRSRLVYGLCVVVTLGAFWAFHRFRLRVLRRREARLATLVRERTRELEASREEMRVRALKDGLTHCWNRVATMEIIGREMEKCLRSGDGFALVLLDLDYFKRINDTHGHLAGDAVLVEVARRLKSAVRPYDAVGRYGGEEFIVVLPGLRLPADAGRIDALRAIVRTEPVDIGAGNTLAVTASFGVVSFTSDMKTNTTELLGLADQALYRSKNEGRDRITYADSGMLV